MRKFQLLYSNQQYSLFFHYLQYFIANHHNILYINKFNQIKKVSIKKYFDNAKSQFLKKLFGIQYLIKQKNIYPYDFKNIIK